MKGGGHSCSLLGAGLQEVGTEEGHGHGHRHRRALMATGRFGDQHAWRESQE